MNDNRKTLYNALLKLGYTESRIGTLHDFEIKMNNPKHRRQTYNALLKIGYTEDKIGSYSYFESKLLGRGEKDTVGAMLRPVDPSEITSINTVEKPVSNITPIFPEPKETFIPLYKDPIGGTLEIGKNFGKGLANTISGSIEGAIHAGVLIAGAPGRIVEAIADSDEKNPAWNIDLPYYPENISKEMYQFANERAEYIESVLPSDPKWRGNFLVEDVPQALGSTVGFASTGMLGRVVGASEILSASLAGAFLEAQEFGAEQFERTGDIKTGWMASGAGLLLGATEGFGLKRYFKILDKVGKTPFLTKLADAGKEGLEEFFQEGLQQIGENWTAQRLGDETRDLIGNAPRGAAAGFVSGVIMAFLGHGVRRRWQNHPEEREDLKKTANLIDSYLKENVNEINLNADVAKVIAKNKNLGNVIHQVGQRLDLDAKQKETFKQVLLKSDQANEIKEALFKKQPELFEEKNFIYGALHMALTDSEKFIRTYDVKIPTDYKQSYLLNLAKFIKNENLINRPEMKDESKRQEPETIIKETPLPKRQQSTKEYSSPESFTNTDYDDIFFQKRNDPGREAKSILSGDVTTPEVINKAKEILKDNFDQEYEKFLGSSNNQARLKNATDKTMEEGLILEDFVRRTVAANLINEPDINSDLFGEINSLLSTAADENEISFDLKGTNVMPFNDPKSFNITSKFDDWIDKQQGKINLTKSFQAGLSPFGQKIVERFRKEYLAKNNFTSIPKERLQDFKKDWNNWLKENFGLRHEKGIYDDEELYGLDGILSESPIITTETIPGTDNEYEHNHGRPNTKVTGSEVIISGDFLLNDMSHEYTIGDQEGAGLGWYIYSEVNEEPFIYEWQSDILPDLFGKSVSSTTKQKDDKGKVASEIETLTSGEVRITDKNGTKYYNQSPTIDTHREITKKEFEAKKEKLSKQNAEEGLKDFIEPSGFEDYLRAKAEDVVTYSDATLPIGEFNREVEKVYQELLKKELSGKITVLPTLENLYKKYWNIWLMHSFMYAKEKGHNEVWLPTGAAMSEIERSEATAKMYATKWDTEGIEWEADNRGYEIKFNQVGPYWTALNKIKGIKLELATPEWSNVPLIKADISNVNTKAIPLFQKGVKSNSNITYSDFLKTALGRSGATISTKEGKSIQATPTFEELPPQIEARTLQSSLSEAGFYDPTIENFTKWAIDYSGNPKVNFIGPNQVITGNIRLGDNPGVYRAEKKNNKYVHSIGINKEFQSNDPSDVYKTLSHEVTHTAIQQGLKENRQFRTEVTELMTDFLITTKNNGTYRSEFESAFENVSEFIAYTMSNTSGIRSLMEKTPIENSINSNFLQRLTTLIKGFFKNILSLKDVSYYNGMEVILARNLGYDPQSQYMFNDNEIKDHMYEKIKETMNKSFMITNAEMQDPRVIQSTAELLGKEKGLALKDYYTFIKTYSYPDFRNALLNNDTWNVQAKFHYDAEFRKTFPSLDAYKNAVIKNLFNLANTMVKIPYVRLIINQHRNEIGDTQEFTEIKEFPDVFTDKNGNTKISMNEHLKLFDVLPYLEQLFGVKFSPMMVDSVETKYFYEDNHTGTSWESIAEDHTPNKNDAYAKIFGASNYIYLGNWADKNTIVLLKPSDKIDSEKIKAIGDAYQEKKVELAKQLYQKEVGEDKANDLVQKYGTIEDAITKTGHPLGEYLENNQSKSKIIRIILEDIKLGGSVQDGELKSAMYDINRPETYNALGTFKYPYLVSPTRYVHQDPNEIKNLLDRLSLKKHGMKVTQNGIQTTTVVVNVNDVQSDKEIEINGQKYNLKNLLINSLGTERFDGAVYYVKGGFNQVWDYLHGAVKKGIKKGWIGNKFEGTEFRLPFYSKQAFHMMPSMDPIAQWMQDNNITLLVTTSAAKVNSYDTTELLDDVSGKTFQIPFNDIHRINEKPGVKNDAVGLVQTFSSNYNAKTNKSFVDKNWNRAIDDLISYTIREFTNSISDINYASVIEHLKSKALEGTSEYEKSVAGVVNELLIGDIDKAYLELKTLLPSTESSAQKTVYKRQLQEAKDKLTLINETLGDKYGSFFQEPFFSIGIKSYLGRKLSDVINFKIPSTWAVLSPDAGILTPSRIEVIKKYTRNKFISDKKMRYEELKPYLDVQKKYVKIDSRIDKAKDEAERNRLLGERKVVENELDQFADNADIYENELEKFYDENGRVNLNIEESQTAIDKNLKEIIDENGFLRDGYVMISRDIADEYGIKEGDKVAGLVVPSSNGMSASAHIVAGILNENMLEPGAVIYNSEYIQTILGKDFDIDTSLLVPYSEAFSEEGWKGFTETLKETYDKHRKDVRAFYKNHVNSNFDEAGVYSDKAKLDLITQSDNESYPTYELSDFKEGTIFDPLSDSWRILEKFNKEIGIPVNRRKIFTFKNQIGLKTRINDQVLNPNHKDSYRTYMILDVLTHHMVDMPTNTGSFYYKYDDLVAFDQDNGTKYSKLYKEAGSDIETQYQITKEVSAIKRFENFLFTYAIKLNAKYNLDDREGIRDYEDTLKYIGTQQDINTLLKTKDYKQILEAYYNFIVTSRPGIKTNYREYLKGIAKQYLNNMEIGNLDDSPMNKQLNSIDLSILPNVVTPESDYLLTQANMISSILNDPKFVAYKKIYDNLSSKKEIQNAISRIPNSGVHVEGLNIDSNKLIGKLFYMTLINEDLHRLKAQAISLIYPIDQSTKAKSQVEKLSTGPGIFPDNIYQKTNEKNYPQLFDVLLKNKSYRFKDEVYRVERKIKSYERMLPMIAEHERKSIENRINELRKGLEAKIGIAKLIKTDKDQLVIEYPNDNRKPLYWHGSELLDDQSIQAANVHKYIKDQLANEPIARYNLSSLLSLGGRNTSLDEKEKMVIDLLNEELPKYSEFERSVFWISLLGKPDHKPKYPLNFVAPEKSSTNNYHSQKILLHILGQVKDNVGRRFMNLYGQKFKENYTGKTIKDIQRINRILDDSDLDSDVEVFFELKKQKAEQTGNPQESERAYFKMIYDIAFGEKERDYSKNSLSVGKKISFSTGEIENITPLQVTEDFSKFPTRIPMDVNHEMVAFTKGKEILKEISYLESMEDYSGNIIRKAIKGYQSTAVKKGENIIKWFQIGKEGYRRFAEIRENNEMQIKSISKERNGIYAIETSDGLYADAPWELRSTELEGYNGDIDSYINKKAKGKEKYLWKAAIEAMKLFGVDNIQTLRNTLSYIDTIQEKFANTDFGRMDEIQKLKNKYENLIKRFRTLGITYYPRIIKKENLDEAIKKAKESNLREEIKKRIKLAKYRKEQGLEYDEKYDVTENKIPELVSELSTELRDNMLKREYGEYVYAFQMKRINSNIMDGIYEKDSLKPDVEHQRLFHQMLQTDLMLINWLEYQYETAKSGRSKKTIDNMRKWFAASVANRNFLTKPFEIKNLKEKDQIRFYYDGEQRNGWYKSQDQNYLYLQFDEDIFRERLLNDINDARKTHDKIVRDVKTGPMTEKQYKLLRQLYMADYTKTYPSDSMTNKDANEIILPALEKALNNPSTWGRFKKENIYSKQYVNGKIAHVNQVEKYLDQYKATWATVGKSLGRGFFLAGTTGARANVTDAQFMLMRDIGAPRYFKSLLPTLWYNIGFLWEKHKRGFGENIKDYQEIAGFYNGQDLLIDEQRKLVDAVVIKYLMESGVLRHQQFGKEIASLGKVSLKDMKGKIPKAIGGITDMATFLREWFEMNIRISAAYMYGMKAVYRDRIYNPKEIESAIEHGIAFTQGLYHPIYKKIGENSEVGSFLMQFSHYNTFMLQGEMMQIRQHMRNGSKYDVRNLFQLPIGVTKENGKYKVSRKYYKRRNAFDPSIPDRMVMDQYYDAFGRTMEVLFPGLRAGSPTGRVIHLAIYLIGSAAARGLDWDDDGFKIDDLIFSVLSFYLGLGATLPIQAIWSWLKPSDKPKEIERILPVNNRLTNQFFDLLWNWGGKEPESTYDYEQEINDYNISRKGGKGDIMKGQAYDNADFERALLGMNLFEPAPRSFSSIEAQKFQAKPFRNKVPSFLPIVGDNTDVYIPIYNYFHYDK